MESKIDKFQEVIAKLKTQGKATIIPKEQFSKEMELMNNSVEKTRDEYLNIEANAQSRAAEIIVR
ncbi:MAG: hypothetical protein HY951_00695 [Bacteroidia bacterium]|nr:hypothetical protein [Bacteroidia bacterium]